MKTRRFGGLPLGIKGFASFLFTKEGCLAFVCELDYSIECKASMESLDNQALEAVVMHIMIHHPRLPRPLRVTKIDLFFFFKIPFGKARAHGSMFFR